jgi:short-subunit dehydrogenase
MPKHKHQTVVITGASTGIGRALASAFFRQGYDLGLAARRLDLLEEFRSELLAQAQPRQRVAIVRMDVDREDDITLGLQSLFDSLGGADIVVVNAGINRLTRVGQSDFSATRGLIQTNLLGAIATVDCAARHMVERGKGQIVGISSLASLQAVPKQGAYCATKAGFSMYLDAARLELQRKNVLVTKILPGFVVTDIMPKMTQYPFAVTAESAANEIVRLVERRVRVGVVPAYPWKWLRPFFGHFPDWLWRKLA